MKRRLILAFLLLLPLILSGVLWNLAIWRPKKIAVLPRIPEGVSVSPDGKKAAVFHSDWLAVYDLKSGAQKWSRKGKAQWRALTWAGDGKRLFAAFYEYRQPAKDWDDSEEVIVKKTTVLTARGDFVGPTSTFGGEGDDWEHHMEIRQSPERLALMTTENWHEWNASTRAWNQKSVLEWRAWALSKSGERFVGCDWNGVFFSGDANNGKIERRVTIPKAFKPDDWTGAVRFSNFGRWAAVFAVSPNDQVSWQIFEPHTARRLWSFSVENEISNWLFSPDESEIAVANGNRWEIRGARGGKLMRTLPLVASQCAFFSPDGQFLYSMNESGRLFRQKAR